MAKDRVPPKQRVTDGFPVLQYGEVPQMDIETWNLRIFGLVEKEITWNWGEFQQLPMTSSTNDIHCVTGWSKLDNVWEGVFVQELMKEVQLLPEAEYVLLHAEGGWTTNLPLEDFLSVGSLLATKHNGEELALEHGWPVRVVVPHLYFWKSAKWLRGIEFMAKDQPGFWEKNGYHMYGNPWKSQRFAWS